MRSVVMYLSEDGAVDRIARAVAEGLSERGESWPVALPAARPEDLEHAQLVVIGASARAKGLGPAIRRAARLSPPGSWFGRPVAVFEAGSGGMDASTGSAGSTLAARLLSMGALLLEEPQRFLVAGTEGPLEESDVVRARLWGRHLHLSERVSAEGE
jgi:flavodoxin